MPIPRYDYFDFRFRGGRGIRKSQVDWSVDDGDADAYVQSLATSGVLPSGNAGRRALRWNNTTSSWEAFSSESTYYYALTVTTDTQQIAAVMIDALTTGFNRSIRGRRPNHYNSSVGEVVLSTQPSAEAAAAQPIFAYYPINGAGSPSWEADAGRGRAASVAALAAFNNISTVYLWIILAEDVSGAFLANRYWNVVPRPGSGSEPAGVITNTPAFTQVNQNLIINGVTFVAARARIEWEPGTTIHNFELTPNSEQDAPSAVWQTP